MEIDNNSEVIDTTKEDVDLTQQRITTRYMTKYEKARILGARALQLRYFFII